MKKLLTLTMVMMLLMSLAACGEKEPEPTEAAPMIGMPNPYLTCETAEEMQEKAGLEVSLPHSLPQWVTETVYRTIPDELIEVIYRNEENEIRVRIAEGSEDISGVYDSDHTAQEEVPVGDYTVHVKGDTDASGARLLFVCTWNTAEGRTYSVTSTQGVPEEVMLKLIAEIR